VHVFEDYRFSDVSLSERLGKYLLDVRPVMSRCQLAFPCVITYPHIKGGKGYSNITIFKKEGIEHG